jgi:hypothetical protein
MIGRKCVPIFKQVRIFLFVHFLNAPGGLEIHPLALRLCDGKGDESVGGGIFPAWILQND